MIKKLIDKINGIWFIVVTSAILVGVLLLGVFHIVSMLLAFLIVVALVVVFSYVLTIKDRINKRKREKAQESAYLSIRDRTIREIAELTNLDAGEAAAYSKLQDITLFDLFAIAKRAQENNK